MLYAIARARSVFAGIAHGRGPPFGLVKRFTFGSSGPDGGLIGGAESSPDGADRAMPGLAWELL